MYRSLNIIILIFLAAVAFAQDTDLTLANQYYERGEYEKAGILYEKLSNNKNNAFAIHNNYLQVLLKLKDYDKAEKFLKKQIKNFNNMISYQADLANLLETEGKLDEANTAYQNLIKEAATQDANVFQLQNFFYRVNKMDLLIQLFLEARKATGDATRHDVHLARAYLYAGKKDKMLEEVFSYGLKNQASNYVQRTIQDNINDEQEIEMLERLLYTYIQNNPNEPYYNEILIWHLIQQKDFNRAFIQARSLDKRLNQQGTKVFELAELAFENRDYKASSRIFSYLITEYPQSELYPIAKRWYIQSKEEIVKNTYPVNNQDINDLINQYNSLLEEYGKTPKTIDVLRNIALLHAFYLGDHQKATDILQEAVVLAGSNVKFKDQCKMDMGDIFILKDEPWESTLLYMQVERSQKEDQLGEQAKLKNARLHYYTGEFELAKELLDILKKATTREIANDAMQLSLLIQDNLGLDTTDAALKAYAAVELLLFQNKNLEALEQLKSLYVQYKTNSLADEIIWLSANTELKLNNTKAALDNLNIINENYKFDILADDALFLTARIYDEYLKDNEEAMKLYRQILKQFPGSIYGADARKRFRELRGDFVF